MTAACLMSTYQPLALSFTRGLGTRLWDQQGREYLDAVAGVAVTNVGHSHPRLVAAISEQAGLLLHTSNLYSIDWQQQLARRLAQLSGLDRAFFNNSGAEANETALKLARLHGWKKGIEQPLVVVMENAFHGRTLGTMAASDARSVREGALQVPRVLKGLGVESWLTVDTIRQVLQGHDLPSLSDAQVLELFVLRG